MEDPVATLTGSVQQQRHQEQALAVDQQQQQPLFHQTPNDDLLGRHHHLSSPGVVAAQTFQKSRTAADAALDKLDPSTATVVTAATSASSITSSVVEPRPAMSVSSSPLAQLTSIATLQAEVLRTGTTRLTGAPLRDTSNSVQDVDQPSAASSSSSPPSPHPGIHPDYDSCPAIVKLPAGDWEQWLEKEKIHCRWNMIRLRKRDKQTFSRGPTACEWTREFQCEHAGQYRDRKDPNIDPSKKRKRSGSIKCNCPASIKMRKQFLEDEVVIEYFWKHEGHTPGVMEDIKAQRLPQDLKTWIKDRAIEGYEWKSVKTMMLSGTPTLDQVSRLFRFPSNS
ncbi:MAG: hypothetical protein J3Q66DRAFT_111596 [Benniella sp.]|nr:MAG: hypothetical protein J3Q66DRAFT_111596 [Benniella sp.]